MLNPPVNGKIQGLFKAFGRFSSTFKANLIFKDFLRQSCIFKYFSSLCQPCIEVFQGNQIYTVVLSVMLNSFPSLSLSTRSTVQQKVAKINSLLTCLCLVHFRGMIIPLDFYFPCIVCYEEHFCEIILNLDQ